MRKEILRMERVTYKEHGITQLENFNITIRDGEILGLVPINHVGLDALMRLLVQNLPLHYGYIYYQESLVNHWKYPSVRHNRISVIQNKSCLAAGLTVADNIFVLRRGFKKWLIHPKVLIEQLEPFMKEIGMDIPGDTYVENLSSFERFVVELVKAVVAGSKLIVLDDIGTFISDEDLKRVEKILKYYSRKGIAFLNIATHMEDIWKICGRVAIIANGQIIKYYRSDMTVPRDFQISSLKDYNRHVEERVWNGQEHRFNKPVFESVGISTEVIPELNFCVHAGECVVLQALDNSTFVDLVRLVSGEFKPEAGVFLVEDEMVEFPSDRRLGVIQELPIQGMLFSDMSYLDNLCFTLDHRFPDVWTRNGVKKSICEEYSAILGEEVFYGNVEELREVEKYDLIYTRILLQNPKIVFCIQPFKRAEVGLRMQIMEHLEKFLDKGIGVVVVAVNLADSLALADRLIRIGKGREPVEYSRKEFGELSINTPWRHLYREDKREDGSEGWDAKEDLF